MKPQNTYSVLDELCGSWFVRARHREAVKRVLVTVGDLRSEAVILRQAVKLAENKVAEAMRRLEMTETTVATVVKERDDARQTLAEEMARNQEMVRNIKEAVEWWGPEEG